MDDSKIIYARRCVECSRLTAVVYSTSEFVSWIRGELIQKAMPTTSAEDREFLLSGFCPECQKEIFTDDEDDDFIPTRQKGEPMINQRRGAGVWFAYDLKAISPVGKVYKQGYYEDELEEAKVDADTLIKLGYRDVTLTERKWHKEKTRRY